MLALLPILATLSALAALLILGRPRYLAKVAGALPSLADRPKISIIVPARNEEGNIPALLASLQSELDSLHEVIIVDDSSTDDTARLATSGGARVTSSQALPDGWNGKPWACSQGAATATGDWLYFLDADVRLHPGALAKLLLLTTSGDTRSAYSIYPHHTISQPYEQLSAYFNALMVAGINAFGFGKSAGSDAALFGQSLLISKELYAEAGGHAAVKDKVLENFYLAEIIKSLGGQCRCLLGKGLVSMRMFPAGFKELWSSWKKGCVSGASNVDTTALVLSSLWISAGMLSIVSLCLLGSSHATDLYTRWTTVAYLTNVLACVWAFRIAGSFSLSTAMLFPIALLFYQTLFFKALIDKRSGKKTNWKGRMVN